MNNEQLVCCGYIAEALYISMCSPELQRLGTY